MAVLYLIVLPIAWFALVMLLHGWLGPLRHRLRCPQCSYALVAREFERAVERGACPRCGARLLENETAPG
jgi:DNA-directed RNA polymerase subunit RPC12/RpoP